MSSTLPLEFNSSSCASSTLTDVVASYRRAQTFLSSSNITTSDAFPEDWARRDETEFDHDSTDPGEACLVSAHDARTPNSNETLAWIDTMQPTTPMFNPNTNERTPLLVDQKGASFQNVPISKHSLLSNRSGIPRHLSSNSLDVEYHHRGSSTFGQTLFNSTAILLGVGMLSEPLAFACAGWGVGTLLIISYGFVTCYTAKILAHIILSDSSLRTYADIGAKAFGKKSTSLTSLFFCLELFSVSVVLITLYADSLHLVASTFSSNQYKVLGLIIIVPTILMPLSVLSYASVLGTLSSVLIIACIFIDGFSKREAPGSLWQPAETEMGVNNTRRLGLAFGLFMAGFGGHPVIPSLARDMADPSGFDKMINMAFAISTVIYGLIGTAGYLMFGTSVSDEISRDIIATPGYNISLNKLAVWMLVVTPLSKFALATRPLNLTVEIWLGIDKPAESPCFSRPASPTFRRAATLATSPRTSTRPWLLILERITLALLMVGVSILVPGFSTVMAFLGSFSTFVLCVIGPVCAKVCLQKRCSWYDATLLSVSVVMAAWGTYSAF